MKKLLVCALLLGFSASGWAQEKTPEGQVNQRLQQLLLPDRNITPLLAGPMNFPEPKRLRNLELALPPLQILPPRPQEEGGKTVRPRLSREPVPLLEYRQDPDVPQALTLPTTPSINLPEVVDGNLPIPVPMLARYQPDRAALADATAQSSREAALARALPNREDSTPFTPMNLPDPFQNQQTGRLRVIPPESPVPQVAPPAIQVR